MGYTRENVKENLCDCACSNEYISRFMECFDHDEGRKMDGLLLERRKQLLDELHECKANIDRLDYLEYRLRQEEKVS